MRQRAQRWETLLLGQVTGRGGVDCPVSVNQAMKKKAMKKTAKSYKTSRGALTAVFKGTITKSKGGLTKDKLMKTKSGKVRISPRVRVFRWLALW